MLKQLLRPQNPYDPAWALYWEQNPNLRRGVGADGVNDDDPKPSEDDPKPAEDDPKPGADDPKPSEDDKSGKPTDGEAKLLKEVMDKKQKLKATSEELDGVKKELDKFKGIDLEQVKALLASQEEAKTQELEKKGEWDKLKAQMVDQHNATIQELKDALTEANGKTEKLGSKINDLTVGHSFDASSFINEDLHLTSSKARIIYGSHFSVEDGKVVAYDKPASSSERTMLVDGDGNALPFNAAIKKIVDADPDRDHVVKSKAKPGSDSKPKDKGKPAAPELKGASKIAAALGAGK